MTMIFTGSLPQHSLQQTSDQSGLILTIVTILNVSDDQQKAELD